MREMRFRAWASRIKQMIYLSEPTFCFNEFSEGERFGLMFKSDNKQCCLSGYDALMQYTGLNDKNGKEIYEGDIVKAENGYLGEIWWDEEYAQFRNIYRLGNCVLCQDGKFPLWHSFHAIGSTKFEPIIEVIGNIHQNPELLKG